MIEATNGVNIVANTGMRWVSIVPRADRGLGVNHVELRYENM